VFDSELFLRSPLSICSVWFRVVFGDTSLYLFCLIQRYFPGHLSLYLLCLIQGCFEDTSLFVVSDSEMFLMTTLSICSVWFSCFWEHISLFVVSDSGLFLRTALFICSVWFRVFF
jgi:hypothetical protein